MDRPYFLVAGRVPAPRPPDPAFARLAACHAEILRCCAVLEQTVARDTPPGADPALREAAAFIDHEVRVHHQVEESQLFARLAALPLPAEDRVEIDALLSALREDHCHLEALWLTLRPSLLHRSAPPSIMLRALVQSFVAGYRHHMKREDAGIFPFASRHLPAADLDAIAASLEHDRDA